MPFWPYGLSARKAPAAPVVGASITDQRAEVMVTNIRATHNGDSLSVSWDDSARAIGYDVTPFTTPASAGTGGRRGTGRARACASPAT